MYYRVVRVGAETAAQLNSGDAVELAMASDQGVDLDKMFFAVHYLLGGRLDETGDAGPSPVFAGEELQVEFGYGGASFVDATTVASLAETFGVLDEGSLRARFDLDLLRRDDVYPHCWDEDPEQLEDEVVGLALELLSFYREAAADESGLVAAIQ